MEIECSCGTVHFVNEEEPPVTCICGVKLTGIFSKQALDEYANNLRVSMLESRLAFFSSEELLDEVKRRLSDAK